MDVLEQVLVQLLDVLPLQYQLNQFLEIFAQEIILLSQLLQQVAMDNSNGK